MSQKKGSFFGFDMYLNIVSPLYWYLVSRNTFWDMTKHLEPFNWNKNIIFCIFWCAEYSGSDYKKFRFGILANICSSNLWYQDWSYIKLASSLSQLSKSYATCPKRRFLAWEIWVFPIAKKIPFQNSWVFLQEKI